MKKEIKFRAKSFDEDVDWAYSTDHGLSDFFHGIEEGRYNEETLGQFTGLTDKTDIEIYEGDIVELETYGRGKVVFNEGMFQYKPIGIKYWEIEKGVRTYAIYPTIGGKVEVVGNIYEDDINK